MTPRRSIVALGLGVALAATLVAPSTATAATAAPRRASVVDTSGDASRLAAAKRVLTSPRALTVSVIGDSVGNDPGEWVSMWAGNLATNRYVFVHHFDWKTQTYSPDTEVHSPSATPTAEPIVVWNFGWPGGTPQRALDHLAVGIPDKPDLAIVSFGHNVSSGKVERQWSALHAGLRSRFGAVPTITTLAHMTPVPRVGQAEGRVRLLRWLRKSHLAYIDERAVLDRTSDPYRDMWDSTHPNVLGYRLIADLVTTTPPAATCPNPALSRAVARYGKVTSTTLPRATKVWSTLRITDTCGAPLRHAWVQLTTTPENGRRPVVVSTQTDAAGLAPVAVTLPAGFVGTLSGVATDGTTTVQVPAKTLR